MKKVLKTIGTILLLVLLFLGSLLIFSAGWAFRTWPELKMEEMIFELQAPLTGTGNGMIRDYVLSAGLPAAAVLAAGIVLFIFLSRKSRTVTARVIIGSVGAVLAVTAIVWASVHLSIPEYLRNRGDNSTFVEDHYADPNRTAMTFPEKKRNLIYIYLESMETTFADKEHGGAFDFNCIPELTQLALENESFSGNPGRINGAVCMTGTTWTMGAMFAQTSGLPLMISVGSNAMDAQESFFSEVGTLGDILEKEGYSQTLLIGSDATFGGRELYFTDHGNYFMDDYDYAIESGRIPSSYKVFWGYEDEKPFENAKAKLTELAAEDEPFNLTMLTVDTHFEDGYVCRLCGDEFGDNQYANVMACSSRQVAEFVEWLKQQDFYEDTAIVLAGDHITMDSDFCKGIDKDYQRKAYVCYVNPAAGTAEPQKERIYTTFDAFPTTLAAMGVKIEGERLGLGTNLFSSVPTLTEEFGIKEENAELKKKSAFLDKLETVDENAKAKQPEAYYRCVSYDDKANELVMEIYDIHSMPEDLASIRAVITGPDGDRTVCEKPGSELRPDLSMELRFDASVRQAVYGRMDVALVGKSGKEYIVADGDTSPMLMAGIYETDIFLRNLKQVLGMTDCSVLMASYGTKAGGFTGETGQLLAGLGIQSNFEKLGGCAFAAMVQGDKALEETGKETAEIKGKLSDGTPFELWSSCVAKADGASILIDGIDYSLTKKKGISFVLYSPELGVVHKAYYNPKEKKGQSTIEAVGKFRKIGRIHLLATDFPISKPGRFHIAAVYWYDDAPDQARTLILHKDSAEVRSGLIKGRAFARSDLHVRLFCVNWNSKWNVVGEATFSI